MYTLVCVALGWVLFAFEDIAKGWAYFKVLLGGAAFCNGDAVYQILSYLPLLAVCAVASTPLGTKLYRRLNDRYGTAVMTAADGFGIVAVAGLAMAYLISGSYNPFLYFRF